MLRRVSGAWPWGLARRAGVLPLLGLRRGGVAAAGPAFVVSAIALVAALTHVNYRQRAVAMVVLGVLSAMMGFYGQGPAIGIVTGGLAWSVCRLLVAAVLPAALLFRARYRAYAGARLILGAAFASALPYIGTAAGSFIQNDFGIAQIGAVLAVVTIVASLSGFMGSNTTGAGSWMALSVIMGLTVELALQALGVAGAIDSAASIAQAVASALAFAGVAGVVALGLFQILAWRFAADARRIDLHAISKPPDSRRGGRRASGADWSTRG